MSKGFPLLFSFKAFETISATIDKFKPKITSLGDHAKGVNNKFHILAKNQEHWQEGLHSFVEKLESPKALLTALPFGALSLEMIHTATEAEETASKFEQVFKNVDEEVKNNAIGELTKGFSLSTATAQEFVSTMGLFGKDIGLSEKQALKMGEQMTALSVQVAGFRKVAGGATATSEAFRSAMMGNTRGLKSMGILIDEADVKTQAMEMAQKGARFESVEQAKALATLALIQKRTIDDQTEFQHSQHELGNQTRVFQETLKELSNTFGAILMPVASAVMGVLNRLGKALLGLSPTTKKIIIIFAAVVSAVGPIIFGLGALASLIPVVTAGFAALAAFSLTAALPFILIGAAIAAVIAAGVLLIENWDAVSKFFVGMWDKIVKGFQTFGFMFNPIIGLAALVISAWEPVSKFFSTLFDSISKIGQMLQISPASFGVAPPAQSIGARAQALGQAAGAQETRTVNDARVQVDFLNTPRGTKISSTSTGTPPFLDLGMAMGGQI